MTEMSDLCYLRKPRIKLQKTGKSLTTEKIILTDAYYEILVSVLH